MDRYLPRLRQEANIDRGAGLDDPERKAVLGGNAARLPNIEAPSTPT
jgi:hypothetical protein